MIHGLLKLGHSAPAALALSLTPDRTALQSKAMIPVHDRAPADDRVLEFCYTVVFEPGAEGGFIASIPAFAGLSICGDTLRETRAMARQAIEECLAALIKHGGEIPTDSNLAHIERIAVSV